MLCKQRTAAEADTSKFQSRHNKWWVNIKQPQLKNISIYHNRFVLGILPRSTCAAYALIGGLLALLCNIARWNSRWAWDKNMITIIINIRVSSIAPEFPRIASKQYQIVVTRSFALTWVSTDRVKTISNCCDRGPLRHAHTRAILQVSNHRSLTIFIQNSNSNLHESSNYFTLHLHS